MAFLKLSSLNVNLKGARGLAFQPRAYALRPQIVSAVISPLDRDYVSLKPGEETEIALPLPALPLNANVKHLKGSLDVRESKPAEGAEAAKLEQRSVIEEEGEPPKTFHVAINQPTLPRNVTLRLDGGEVFWNFAGDMAQKTYELPDLAEYVNAYLDKLPPETREVSLRFLIKSDTPGRVKLIIDNESLVYSSIQTQTWANPLDDTIRLDRNFQLDYGTIERLTLDAITDPIHKRISLDLIQMDLGGEFGLERLLGSVEEYETNAFATVSSDYSLAQSFALEIPLRCVGVTGIFQTETEAELYLEIQNGRNGSPSAESPLTKANLSLAPAGKDGNKPWTFVNFEAPVDLQIDTPYFLVIKGIRGKVRLGLGDQPTEYLQKLLVNRGGQLWKNISSTPDSAIVGMLRLLYLPELDNQTAAVEIGVKRGQALQRFDPLPEPQTVSFDTLEGIDINHVTIVIRSHAQGRLSLANVIQEYSPAS